MIKGMNIKTRYDDGVSVVAPKGRVNLRESHGNDNINTVFGSHSSFIFRYYLNVA